MLFVSNEDDAVASAIDLGRGEVVWQVPVGREPEGIAESPDHRWLVVTSEDQHNLSWIDLASHTKTGETETETRPRHVEFTPDGKELWAAAETGGVVQVVSPDTHKVLETIHFTPPGVQDYKVMPCGIRFTPDGRLAVVALGRANHVALVDVATRRVLSYVRVGARPWQLALSADGTRALVANGMSDDLSVVDLASAKLVATYPAGAGPWGVAIAP